MHVQRYRSHLVLLAVVDHEENRWANDIDGSALAAQPGKSQGRPLVIALGVVTDHLAAAPCDHTDTSVVSMPYARGRVAPQRRRP